MGTDDELAVLRFARESDRFFNVRNSIGVEACGVIQQHLCLLHLTHNCDSA